MRGGSESYIVGREPSRRRGQEVWRSWDRSRPACRRPRRPDVHGDQAEPRSQHQATVRDFSFVLGRKRMSTHRMSFCSEYVSAAVCIQCCIVCAQKRHLTCVRTRAGCETSASLGCVHSPLSLRPPGFWGFPPPSAHRGGLAAGVCTLISTSDTLMLLKSAPKLS